jgi:hypothetical protein
MACARNTNIEINEEYANSILNTRDRTNCRKYKSVYPSFTPTINSLSVTSSVHGTYSNVMINGSNFLPPCYGTTYVNFGPFNQFSGSYEHLPIIFYSTSAISFIVPISLGPGFYNVQVGNIYNGNFSPAVNQSYPGIPNLSNSQTYTLT